MRKAYEVTAIGKVQAVGFRRKVQDLARQFGLVGEVENLSDGNVHILVQGEDSKIESFLGSIRMLPEPVVVGNLEKTETAIQPSLRTFSVKHGDTAQEIEEALGSGLEMLTIMNGGLTKFSRDTNGNFDNLAGRYDVISETLAKVVQQTSESNNELKRSMDTLVGKLDELTNLAKTYFETRLKQE